MKKVSMSPGLPRKKKKSNLVAFNFGAKEKRKSAESLRQQNSAQLPRIAELNSHQSDSSQAEYFETVSEERADVD